MLQLKHFDAGNIFEGYTDKYIISRWRDSKKGGTAFQMSDFPADANAEY